MLQKPPVILSGPTATAEIEGQTCRKYDLALRKEGLRELSSWMVEKQIENLKKEQDVTDKKMDEPIKKYGALPSADPESREEEYATMRENAAKLADNLTLENGGVWIDTSRYLLCRTEGTMVIVNPDSENKETMTTKIAVTHFDYGKPLEVSAPEQSKSIEEIFKEIAGTFMGAGFEYSSPSSTSTNSLLKNNSVKPLSTPPTTYPNQHPSTILPSIPTH